MCEKPNRPAGEWPIAFSAISAFGLVVSQHEKRPFWQKKHSPQAMVNGTTTRSPFLQLRDGAADLDDLAHRLVAEDVARLHRRQVAVEEVQVRAADAVEVILMITSVGVLDLRVGDGVDADVALAVPAECFHSVGQGG